MVVWEDRGVLKPPKPPIAHATDAILLSKLHISETGIMYKNSNSIIPKIILLFSD